MDSSEQLAERYLKSLGLGKVVFEPDGNIPPDFSVAGKIGVEVRRLNQNYEHPNGNKEGLEELAIPLWHRLKALLPTIGTYAGESWFVGMSFSRPLPPWQVLKPRVIDSLQAFAQQTERGRAVLRIADNFELDLLPAPKGLGAFFVLAASSDDDCGGFVMGEVERNLRLCIAEKQLKIGPHRHKYQEWWLVLSDHIDFSMEREDRLLFLSEVAPGLQHDFDKIVLLDPRDAERSFVVP